MFFFFFIEIMRIWSFGSVVVTALLFTVHASTISTKLQSGFIAPPLLLELAEGLAVLNQTSYFPFLRHLAQHSDVFTLPTHESYQQALEYIETQQLLDEFTLSLLKLEMATHTYAPMVVAQYQLYNQTIGEVVDYKDKCWSWMQFKDKQACSVGEMRELLNKEDFYGDSFKEPNKAATQIYQTDHVYRQGEDSKVVVLYGDPRNPGLLEMQEYLEELDSTTYVFRYRPWSDDDDNRQVLGLSGYGVELALKSTEYKATDDRDLEDRLKVQTDKTMREQTVLFEDELKEPAQVKGLTEEQVKGLGLQAAQLVLGQPSEVDQMAMLGQLAQNLPRYGHLLAAHAPVNQTLHREIKGLISELGDLKDFVSINGYTLDSLDPFHLTQHIRKESALISNLQSIGLTQAQAIDLLVELGDKSTDTEIRFDMRDQRHAVMWMNDLEHDKRYAMWPSDLGLLGRVMYPGMIQRLRQNLAQVIFALDLSDPQSWAMVLMEIMNSVQRGIPMQFGVVPLIGSDEDSEASQMAKWLVYVRRAYKKKQWQKIVRQSLINHRKHKDSSLVQRVREEYQEFTRTHKTTRESTDNVPLTWDQIQAADKEWLSKRWEDTREYCRRLDLITGGVMFVNGIQMEMSEDYQEEMFRLYQMQVWELAQRLRAGEFSADDQVSEIVYGKGTLRTRSHLVYESDTNPLRFAQLAGSPRVLEWMDKKIQYLSFAKSEEGLVSAWVVGDFSQSSVRQLAKEALEAAKENEEMQVALVQCSQDFRSETEDVDVPQILYQIMTSSGDEKAERALEYLKDPNNVDIELDDSVVDSMEELFEDNQMAVQLALGSEARSYIVVNGRVLPASASFGKGAFGAVAQYELNQRTRPTLQAISKVVGSSESGLRVKVSATVEHGMSEIRGNSILKNKDHDRRTKWQALLPSASAIAVNDPQKARLRIQAVVDPLSEDAQKWIPILQTLTTALSDQVSVELWLRPQLELKELSIKRFYRYLWPSQLEFSQKSGKMVDPHVEFDGVPKEPLLTLGMDVPAAWLVSAVDSVHDLDNIRLSDVSTDIAATYRLTNILVEGHLVDMDSRSPVRGLEVQLGTLEDPAVSETIVMANLGYLQLKANPGVWRFNIRPGGRSADIYRVNDIGLERWNYQRADRGIETYGPVLVTTFSGVTVFPLVSKRPGKENMDVLDEEDEKTSSGLWGKLKGSLSNQPSKDQLDIFAVASGHLYERLMSIMILSVLENTKSHVKFWLIENFLSPSFKSFIPKMAQEFGFSYEFITYKWPQWLHQETEKQRTIWGYKILFLDVMFPLSLDRVIFVDADQIVRADLQELASMDLKGAPYGYTPFCDDRKEIDGYRFWKQGWWKDHLRGKPYHISALYVVDLKRFRQLAAGDRLRGQYQALSRDGGSLANLDQDLPNNMQHLVPIHSLPQEWLWCETWCSDQSLKKAKTIDLCNNPMTKEPKLERARRLLPEWEAYDRRVAEFSKKLKPKAVVEHVEL